MKQILKSLELIQDGETTITITQQDLKESSAFASNFNCPMAVAVKRQLGADLVRVRTYDVRIGESVFEIVGLFGYLDYCGLVSSGKSIKRKLRIKKQQKNGKI